MRGSMSALRRLTFTRCSGECSTALRVTSAPVPAVVGTAMKGNGALTSRLPFANHFKVIERISRIRRQRRDGFAAVDDAAAANRNDALAFSRTGEFSTGLREADRRLAGDGEKCCGEIIGLQRIQKSLHALGVFPVTTSRREPNSFARAGSSIARPLPKTMRVAVANSKFVTIPWSRERRW